jgi:hypothetical protein
MNMKKYIVILAVLALASVGYADPVTETYTNAMGQVFTVTIGHAGSVSSTAIPAAPTLQLDVTKNASQIGQFGVVAGKAAYVGLTKDAAFTPIPQVQIVVNTNYALTGLTPRSIGHMVYSANKVIAGTETGVTAIAVGTTTNDWVLISTAD